MIFLKIISKVFGNLKKNNYLCNVKKIEVERTTIKTATRPMMVEVELSKEMVEAIAEVQSRHNGYDRLSACDDNLNEMYATAFYDGMMHLAKLLKIEIK